MLNEKQVLEIVPVGRSTLWRMEKAGRFPRSTYISPNRRIWFEDEIIAWQKAIAECDPHFDPARGRGKGRRKAREQAAVQLTRTTKSRSNVPWLRWRLPTSRGFNRLAIHISDEVPFERGPRALVAWGGPVHGAPSERRRSSKVFRQE
ncbi:hypothetical protein XH84_15115 [Bradyrhizobium nanningense]|nr:hypothetical protein XH84_15115 [Bradyrhizobium nanningense]